MLISISIKKSVLTGGQTLHQTQVSNSFPNLGKTLNNGVRKLVEYKKKVNTCEPQVSVVCDNKKGCRKPNSSAVLQGVKKHEKLMRLTASLQLENVMASDTITCRQLRVDGFLQDLKKENIFNVMNIRVNVVYP